MPEFRPNPFKVKWEELILKKITDEIGQEEAQIYGVDIKWIVRYAIKRYKEEMEKQKGIKE